MRCNLELGRQAAATLVYCPQSKAEIAIDWSTSFAQARTDATELAVYIARADRMGSAQGMPSAAATVAVLRIAAVVEGVLAVSLAGPALLSNSGIQPVCSMALRAVAVAQSHLVVGGIAGYASHPILRCHAQAASMVGRAALLVVDLAEEEGRTVEEVHSIAPILGKRGLARDEDHPILCVLQPAMMVVVARRSVDGTDSMAADCRTDTGSSRVHVALRIHSVRYCNRRVRASLCEQCAHDKLTSAGSTSRGSAVVLVRSGKPCLRHHMMMQQAKDTPAGRGQACGHFLQSRGLIDIQQGTL